MLSGSADKTLKLWDATTGRLVRTFLGHIWPVTAVAFSPDRRHPTSSSAGEVRKLWDAATGQLIRTFDGYGGSFYNNAMTFSPDGMRVLIGDGKGVALYDTTGRLARTFKHASWGSSVAFSPWGTRFASASTDTTIKLWDEPAEAPIATLMGGRNGEWLVMIPAGFFAASGKGSEMLSVVRGLEVTIIDQVHQSLFNPDLVREALAGDPNGEVREAAKVLNLEKVLDSGPAPKATIISPSDSKQSATDLVSVTVRIEDRGSGVGRIEWRVNGITAAVDIRPPGRGPAYSVSRQLALDSGDNTVEVVAYNASNLLASLPARTTVK